MRMFYFKFAGYGTEFCVCAETKTTAYLDVLDFLRGEAVREKDSHYSADMYTLWTKHSPSDMPKGYSMEEIPPHSVVMTEVS